MSKARERITAKQVAVFEATQPLLEAMAGHLRKIALKKPDATLNKQKVLIINRLLVDLRALLENEPNNKYLDVLSDDELPQYSDATLILSQYEAAMEAFESRYKDYSPSTASDDWRT